MIWLSNLEWSATMKGQPTAQHLDNGAPYPACPCCYGVRPDQQPEYGMYVGHKDGCELEKALLQGTETLSFNGLTKEQEERLQMLAEEAFEIGHAAMKILRHGYQSYNPDGPPSGLSNKEQLERELLDIVAVASAMGASEDITFRDRDGPYSLTATQIWKRKMSWTHYQISSQKSET